MMELMELMMNMVTVNEYQGHVGCSLIHVLTRGPAFGSRKVSE
jgi:hypothetical protein